MPTIETDMHPYHLMKDLVQLSFRYRKSDPELFAVVRELAQKYDTGALGEDLFPGLRADNPLRSYALAERRCHDSTWVNYQAIAQEWDLNPRDGREGELLVKRALRALRDYALEGEQAAYSAEDVKLQLVRSAYRREEAELLATCSAVKASDDNSGNGDSNG